jgi:hypothetical protein
MARVTVGLTRVGNGSLLLEIIRIGDHREQRDTIWWCNGEHVGFLIREDLRDAS